MLVKTQEWMTDMLHISHGRKRVFEVVNLLDHDVFLPSLKAYGLRFVAIF